MLRASGGAVAFRHEIARVTVEEALPPDRGLTLHRRALAALAGRPGGGSTSRALAHHAEAAGDGEAVLRFAPAAAERAAGLGAHREAAAQFARALRFADGLEGGQRAALLERRSYECYLTSAMEDAIEARREALVEHHARGDRLREGDMHRWLSRLAWFLADNATAEAEGREAVELLEQLAPGPSSRWPTATWRSCGCSRATWRARGPGAGARSSSPSASARRMSSSTRSTTSARPSCTAGCRAARGRSPTASRWRSRQGSRRTSRAPTPTSPPPPSSRATTRSPIGTSPSGSTTAAGVTWTRGCST